MIIERLLNSLTDIEFYYYGSDNIDIYGVETLESVDDMRPGILYIADISIFKNIPGCVLFAASSDIPSILKQFRMIISMDYQMNAELNRLNQAVLSEIPLKKIAEICHHIMDSTVFLLDEYFTLLASCGDEEAKRFLPSILANDLIGKDTRVIQLPSSVKCPYDAILAPIVTNGKLVGYILSATWEETVDNDAAAVVLSSIRKILSHCKDFLTYRTPTSKRQQFLNELMALKKVNEENTAQKKSGTGFSGA